MLGLRYKRFKKDDLIFIKKDGEWYALSYVDMNGAHFKPIIIYDDKEE